MKVASWTLVFAGATLAVVLAKVAVAGVVVAGVHLGTMPDGGAIAALLAPTLGAYVARRYTDANATIAPGKDKEP